MKQRRFLCAMVLLVLSLLLASASADVREPSSVGDGCMPYEDVLRLIRWISDGYAENALYEDVVAFTGVEGKDCGNSGPNKMSALGDRYFNWIAQEDPTHFIHVCFRGREDTGRFECCQWNTSGFRSEEWENADLTDWLIANACTETQGVEGVIQRFSNPAVTVSAHLPVRGWESKTASNKMELIRPSGSGSKPRIAVLVYDSMEMFDFYLSSYENVQPAESRLIAGIEMNGRSYTYMENDWLEYTAKLGEKVFIGVQITVDRLNLTPGTEACAVLDSLAFELTDAAGVAYSYAANPTPVSTPEPAPTPVPTPVPTPEPTAAPAPTSTPEPVLAEGVQRYADMPVEIPDYWQEITLLNEATGMGMSVYLPQNDEIVKPMTIPEATVNQAGRLTCQIVFYHGDYPDEKYMITGLYFSDREKDVESMLAGADLSGYEDYSYERIQNVNGLIMTKVTNPGGKIQYCVVSPAMSAGERGFMKLQFIFDKTQLNELWLAEICDAFERTLRLTVNGQPIAFDHAAASVDPATPTVTPMPVETLAPTATPMPVETLAPAATPMPVETLAPTEPISPETGGLESIIGRKYTAVTFESQGYTMDAALLGSEYSVVLKADHTAKLCLAGTEIPSTWTEAADGVLLDCFGAYTLKVAFGADELLLNYMDAMLLHMKAE